MTLTREIPFVFQHLQHANSLNNRQECDGKLTHASGAVARTNNALDEEIKKRVKRDGRSRESRLPRPARGKAAVFSGRIETWPPIVASEWSDVKPGASSG